ncbi:hypothetical protein NDK43_20205 [Neobacillus pocheonensis]|uniref:Uncharacterized protein n=1 Tax=Neobacillus pocheonensis TaxID=363869 RepID=A0ABT0WFC7_9BACI|nr:hypothetical protein [Neobacillus pocheonensis]
MHKRITYTRYFKEFLQETVEDIAIGAMLRWNHTIDDLSLTDFQKITGMNPGLCYKYENHEI